MTESIPGKTKAILAYATFVGFLIAASMNANQKDEAGKVIKAYDYPVCFDFPVGHTERNFAFKCGLVHELSVSNKKVSLKEIPT